MFNADKFDFDRFFEAAHADGLASYQFSNRIAASQYEPVYRKVLSYVRPGDQALDWGAGNGHFSYFLLKCQLNVTTFSFSPEVPDFLRGRIVHRWGDANDPVKLPFTDNAFGYIFSIGVLEHVHESGGDQVASMLEMYRILKPGGLFLCFHFPNKHGWIEPLKKKLRTTAHAHTRRYDESDIISICKNSGFELVELGRYNFLPRNEVANALSGALDNKPAALIFNCLDRLLSRLIPRLATNYYFVARKPAQSVS